MRSFARVAKATITVLFVIWAFTPLSIGLSIALQGRIAESVPWFGVGALFIALPLLGKLPYWKREEDRGRKAPIPLWLFQRKKPDFPGSAIVQVFASANRIQAESVKIALEQMKIPCLLFDEHSSGLMPFLPQVPVRVMVPARIAREHHITIHAVLRRFQPC